MTPGHCKGKAHKPEHLGIAGRRVLVSLGRHLRYDPAVVRRWFESLDEAA